MLATRRYECGWCVGYKPVTPGKGSLRHRGSYVRRRRPTLECPAMKKSLMMMILPAAVAFWTMSAAWAQNVTLKMSGRVRVRYEFLDGQYRPGFDNRDDQLPVRSTLLAELRRGDWRVVGELFDSRAYDTDAGSVLSANEVNVFEPVQAYVQRDFRAPFGDGSSAAVAVGRFSLNIGSRRLVASDDYRNTPQGYTG